MKSVIPEAALDKHIAVLGKTETTSAALGEHLGVDHTGGYFARIMRPLTSIGLVERDSGRITATDVLFQPGLS